MKRRKRDYTGRLFYDPSGLEARLEEMAQKGWKLRRLNNWYIEYEPMEPKKLRYTVTYFSEASEFRPVPTANQGAFVDYCIESGWEFVTAWTQMLIFCTDDEIVVPIDTDPEQKLKSMHHALKRGMLGNCAFQIGATLALLASRAYSLTSTPQYFYSSMYDVLFTALILFILMYQIAMPVQYLLWYHHAKQTVERGEDIPSPTHRKWLDRLIFSVCVVGVVAVVGQFLEQMGNGMWTFYVILSACVIVIGLLLSKLRKSGKLANIWSRIVIVAVCTVVGTAMVFGSVIVLISSGAIHSDRTELIDEPLPLSLSQFIDVDMVQYGRQNDVKESFLLKWMDCDERSDNYELPRLSYEVFQTDYNFVYQHMLYDLLKINSNENGLDARYKSNWREVDIAGTTVSYQSYEGDTPRPYAYVLCTEDTIIEIRFESDFTQQEVDTAIAVLLEGCAN